MQRSFLDFLIRDDEYLFSQQWLRNAVWLALAALLIYSFYAGIFVQDLHLLAFSLLAAAPLAGTLWLIRAGKLKLASALFCLVCMGSMMAASYFWGGVRSGSYFGGVVVLMFAAIFLRGRVLSALTVIYLLFGGWLAYIETSGQYQVNATYNSPQDYFISAIFIFGLTAIIAGFFSHTVRKTLINERKEIEERNRAELQLREQAQYLRALHETTLAIIRRLELVPLLESILHHARDLSEAEHGYIDMHIPHTVGITQMVGHGAFASLTQTSIAPEKNINAKVLAQQDVVMAFNDGGWDPRSAEYVLGLQTVIAVPLKAEGEVIGILGLAHQQPGKTFNPAQVKYLEQFAELAALALDNARLYQASKNELSERKRIQDALAHANQQLSLDTLVLERRSTLLQVAAEVSRAASAILELDILSQQVVDLVKMRFGLYYVGLFLLDEARNYVVLTAATGEAGIKMLEHGHKLGVGNTSMVGWCTANRAPRIALDVGEDAVRFSNPLLPLARSELALPLISRGQVLGAITIQSDKEAAFSSEDVTTFQTMTDQLANAILNARLYDQLEKELEERKRADEQVRKLNTELELRVKMRTLDLEASEEKFRALAENNPLQIMRFDHDGRYLYINRPEKSSLLQPEQIMGKTIREVIDDPIASKFLTDSIHEVFEIGLPIETEYKLGENYVVWSLAPEFDNRGKVVSVITTALDITDRKHMEEELHRRSMELQSTNRELEAFSYSVSHDLRAPLRALDGYSRILLEEFQENIPADGKKYLERVSEASKQMAQLIDDMLRLSRITRAEMHRLPVNLSNMAASILADLQAREPGRPVEIQISPNLTALGDEGLLRMALENLLNNAWKFSSKNAAAKISVGKAPARGKDAYFISDNGVGFDMAYADKLFGTFQRLHRVEDFPGTGIGLAIVQRVIHRHGGSVWAESEPQKGATFYFTLA